MRPIRHNPSLRKALHRPLPRLCLRVGVPGVAFLAAPVEAPLLLAAVSVAVGLGAVLAIVVAPPSLPQGMKATC